jgi:hypothetical protein
MGAMKRSSKPIPKDTNKLAHAIVKFHTEELSEPVEPKQTEPSPERSAISQYLAEIGRKGGLKGGKARSESLTPKQRKEIAQRAANTRWGKKAKNK